MRQMLSILSIDWLQLYVGTQQYTINPTSFHCEKKPYSTRQYSTVESFHYQQVEFATLAYNPFSDILQKDTGLLKISNQFLYIDGIIDIINLFLEETQISVLSVSRFDICADFNKFHQGLTPPSLINRFLKNELLKMGQQHYKLQGSQHKEHSFSYLRFGSNVSPIAVYLYNKTLEFQEVKEKLYIKEKWQRNGLSDTESDVWRLEVSIKGNSHKFVDKDTGEMLTINYTNLLNAEFQTKIYNTLIMKYFDFRINDNQVKKSRMKKIKLFDNIDASYGIYKLTNIEATSRADKIFIAKCEEYNNEIRNLHQHEVDALKIAQNIIISRSNLSEWWRRKSSR